MMGQPMYAKNLFGKDKKSAIIYLPEPFLKGTISVEELIRKRRSVRDFQNKSISLQALSQILWAAQGITSQADGFRSAPSAGALYPLEIYIDIRKVENLPSGVYQYFPETHHIRRLKEKSAQEELFRAALYQDCVREGAVAIIICAVYQRTTRKYGKRGIQYVHIEVGHMAQNIYLQATALDLGTVFVGAFYDDMVREAIGAAENEVPLGIMPVGVPLL